MPIEIREGIFDDPRVIDLLIIHVSKACGQTAPGSAHALDLSGLQSPDIRFWTAWDVDRILGMAALKRLSPTHGEVKSMHTAESVRRSGIGSALLRHLLNEARAQGVRRLSLETGSWDYFRPAHAFYKRHGFTECEPFADYKADPNSIFMTLEIGDSSVRK